MKTKIIDFLKLKRYKPSHCIDTLYTLENLLTDFVDFAQSEPEIDSAKLIRVEPQIIREGNEFPEPREIDRGAAESGMDDRMGIISGFQSPESRKMGDVYRPVVDNTTTPPGRPPESKPEPTVEEIAMKVRIATGQGMSISRVIAKALRPYYINAKVISDGDIKAAASAYEKICCCEADHPWLKDYVNEDFVAGVKWAQEQLVKPK